MKIDGSIALVTGASRGLGLNFIDALVEFGATKIYATARNVEAVGVLVNKYEDLIVPLRLDVTNPDQVEAVAAAAGDVTLLLNSAGVLHQRGLIEAADLSGFEQEMAVNVYGLARMCRAFAPIIEANGGGAITNMLSTAALRNFPPFGTYSATKAAAMSLTECLRFEMRDKSVEVFGVYAGMIDTDMAGNIIGNKSSPSAVARNTMVGMEAGDINIDADDRAKMARSALFEDPEGSLTAQWARAADFRVKHPLR